MEKRQSSRLSDKDWYEKGRSLSRNGSHREAIEALNLAIEKNPLFAEAYFVRGACHYALGSYRQARDDLDAAALLGCQDAQFWSIYNTKAAGVNLEDEEDS